MELFIELGLTMALSLLLSFLISKILSMASTGDTKYGFESTPGNDTMEKVAVYDRKFVKKLRNCDSKREKRVRFVDEVAIQEFTEFESESIDEEFNVRSPEKRDDDEIDQNEKVAAVGSGESFAEECCGKEEVKAEEISIGELKEGSISASICLIEEKLVDESPERATTTFREIEIDSVSDEAGVANSEEFGVLESEDNESSEIDGVNKNEADDEKEGLFDNDDDWEGIERTELEKHFGAAVAFVGCRSNENCISRLGSDVQMQLYGLHKVATEGPCREFQPMALKVSARAKWNAWQQLGNMSPEVAMEQYITLLSKCIFGWMRDNPDGDSKHVFSDGACGKLASDLETFVRNLASVESDSSKLEELKPCVEVCDLIGAGGANSMNRDKQ